MLPCDSDCLPICLFKLEQSSYATFRHGHPSRASHRVPVPLKHLAWGLHAPEPIVLAIGVPREQKVCLIAEPKIIKEFRFLFDLVLGSPAHHNTFCYVSWCEFLFYLDPLWVQMKVLDQDFPSSRLNLWMEFFRLFPTDSLTVFRLTRVLALSFLTDLGVSACFLSLFTVVARNLCVY